MEPYDLLTEVARRNSLCGCWILCATDVGDFVVVYASGIAPGYFTLIGGKAPPAARDRNELTCA